MIDLSETLWITASWCYMLNKSILHVSRWSMLHNCPSHSLKSVARRSSHCNTLLIAPLGTAMKQFSLSHNQLRFGTSSASTEVSTFSMPLHPSPERKSDEICQHAQQQQQLSLNMVVIDQIWDYGHIWPLFILNRVPNGIWRLDRYKFNAALVPPTIFVLQKRGQNSKTWMPRISVFIGITKIPPKKMDPLTALLRNCGHQHLRRVLGWFTPL